MDAKQLGTFIAERRKQLGLTQALLAEKIHVTDKAVSRWERGIGLPEINSIEALADALDLSLTELMQAKFHENKSLDHEEAEKLLADTIQLSKAAEESTRKTGRRILSIFAVISAWLLLILIFNGKPVLLSVASLITGLIAWGIPVWQICFSGRKNVLPAMIASFACSFTAITIQFVEISKRAHVGDWAGIGDTIDVTIKIVVLFSIISLLLNGIMAIHHSVGVSKNTSECTSR